MEFLDINFLHAVHSLYYGRILQKTILYSAFKIHIKKNPQNKKTRDSLFMNSTFVEKRKNQGTTRQNLASEKTQFMPRNLQMPFKNSISAEVWSIQVLFRWSVKSRPAVLHPYICIYYSIIVHCEQYMENFYNCKSLFVSSCF